MLHRSSKFLRRAIARTLVFAAAAALGGAATVTGCGAEALDADSDPSGGSGASGGGDCVAEGTACTLRFAYPLGGEKSVELRGDFAPDG